MITVVLVFHLFQCFLFVVFLFEARIVAILARQLTRYFSVLNVTAAGLENDGHFSKRCSSTLQNRRMVFVTMPFCLASLRM